jgi:hypothetical protein
MLAPPARHVRVRLVGRRPRDPAARPRPPRHQAALLRRPGRRRPAVRSEPKALLRCPEVDRGLDLTSLDAYLDLYYIPPPRSIFAGDPPAPAGALLDLAQGTGPGRALVGPRSRAAADPRLNSGSTRGPRPSSRCCRGDRRCTPISDVPLGAFLSGGLDSSAIVALHGRASARTRSRPSASATAPRGQSYEERPVARRVAEFFATKHREIQLDIDLLDDLEPLVRGFDEPFGSWAALLSHRLSRFTRQHVTVALAGDGGDEVFGGYPRYFGLRLSEHLSHAPGGLLLPRQRRAGPRGRADHRPQPAPLGPEIPGRPATAAGRALRDLGRLRAGRGARAALQPGPARADDGAALVGGADASPSLALGTWSNGQVTPTCAGS